MSLKAAKQRDTVVREQLNTLVLTLTLPKEVALSNNNVPTMKVERVEQFGVLAYANEEFFRFFERLEYVFRKTLTPKLLMMNGSSLIDVVYEGFNTQECVLNIVSDFCESNINSDIIQTVTKYITRSYCRMRGKDFVRKLMSRDTHSLKQRREPTLAAVSDPTIHKAKQKKIDDDIDPVEGDKETEYILFNAATGNLSTEEKGDVDDLQLLE